MSEPRMTYADEDDSGDPTAPPPKQRIIIPPDTFTQGRNVCITPGIHYAGRIDTSQPER